MKRPLIQPLSDWPWPVFALIAFYLPWVYHRAAGLTFNANDLAEWVSLSPMVRGGSVPLLIPVLLRLTLVAIALLCGVLAAISKYRRSQLLYMLLALALAVTLLPPVDFFKGAWDDPNYRQQFLLALATLVGLGAIVAIRQRSLHNFRWSLLIQAIGVIAILCAVSGNLLALSLIRSLNLDALLGGGMLLYVVCIGMLMLTKTKTGPENSSPA